MQNLSLFATVDAPHYENNTFFFFLGDTVFIQLVSVDTSPCHPSQQNATDAPAAPMVAG